MGVNQTGEECRTIIEAGGKAEADKKAVTLGWLIESVQLNTESRTKFILILVVALRLIGALSLAAACVVPVLAFLIGAAVTNELLGGFVGLVGGLLAAIPLAVNGILLKMFAALALAHRDLVRNSFARP